MPSDAAIVGHHARQAIGPTAAGLAEYLPETLRRELSPGQLVEIEQAAREWMQTRGRALPVDIRFSLPLPFRGVFVNILAGSEQRSRTRREQECQRRRLASVGNLLVAICVIAFLNGGLLIGALALSGIVE